MAIRFETSFTVPTTLEQAWAILNDVPAIVPCLPGAELTEVVDAVTYRGLARVKIGPVALVFKGEARLQDVDPVAHRAALTARGGDTKGRGSVQSEMRFALHGQGEQTRVEVSTEITLAGGVAQYGRAVGAVKEVCSQMTQQFARNLAARMQGGEATPAASALSATGMAAGAIKAMLRRQAPTGTGSSGDQDG